MLVRVTQLYRNDTGAWGPGEVSLPEATDAGAGLVEIWILAPRAHFNEKERPVKLKERLILRPELILSSPKRSSADGSQRVHRRQSQAPGARC